MKGGTAWLRKVRGRDIRGRATGDRMIDPNPDPMSDPAGNSGAVRGKAFDDER